MNRSSSARAGALLAFVLAEGVAAHPRPTRSIDQVRLVGATETIPDEAAYDRGKALLATDDVVGALATFRQALSADPRSADAMNGLGVCYDRMGRGDLARTYYVAGLAIDPGSPSLNNNLGYSLYLNGDAAAAIAPLRLAAASNDPAAATAAQATLAKLAGGERNVPVDATVDAADGPHIELTSDDEQRLTFATAAPADPALGDAAGATIIAAVWTPADDAALVAQVDAEDAADAAAAVAARAAAEPATPAPVALAAANSVPAPPSPLPRSSASAHAAPGLVLAQATTPAATPRRGRAGSTMLAAATGGGPKPRATTLFDSDDAELNAFAARMAGSDAAAVALPGDRGRIAARFRT